jgi:hypothetical protein
MLKRVSIIGLGLLAVMALAVSARAGYKSLGLDVSVGSNYFNGSFGNVRSSPDSTQYIGCVTYDYVTSVSVHCFAMSTSGAYASCSASGPVGWQPLASLGPNSMLDVSFSNGTCHTIRVSNGSFWPISVP